MARQSKPSRKKATATSIKPVGGTSLPADYPRLLTALKSRIQAARVQAHVAINRERTLLYWDIGRAILQRQDEEGWGTAVIPRLARDLKDAFPEMDGFSERSLGRMIRFAREYGSPSVLPQAVAKLADIPADHDPVVILPQAVAKSPADDPLPVLQQLAAEIPWGHNITLLEKVKEPDTRLFYLRGVIENGWSRAVLVHQIESELHLRAANRANNFDLALPDPQSDLAREIVWIANRFTDESRNRNE